MKRDEALKKAVDAISQFDQERRDRWKTPAHFPNIPVGGAPIGAVQDWAAPTVHQVIVALEAIGVVKFDEEPACPFKVGDPVRCIYGGKSQGHVTMVLDLWNVRTHNGHVHAVNTLELDAPFAPGDKVKFKDRREWLLAWGSEPPVWTVKRVTFVRGSWIIETDNGIHGVHDLEHVNRPPANRMIHIRAASGPSYVIAADIVIEALEAAGYTVEAKENTPKPPDVEYITCSCTGDDPCPQAKSGNRQRCVIPIKRSRMFVLEKALRVLQGKN